MEFIRIFGKIDFIKEYLFIDIKIKRNEKTDCCRKLEDEHNP